MLIVEGLTKSYGKTVACDNLNFALEDGTLTVMLGPNGAGKSTAIKSIIGFLRYNGIITIDGHPNKSVEAKRLIGYVPEIPALYPNLTVSEHLEFVARAYRLKDYKDWKDLLLRRFQLEDKARKFGDELSKGMQQKLNICCGLLPKPKIVLFDEPMIGLDPHAIKELKNIFAEMKQAGATLLVSTHMIDSVDALWDRTLIMKNGRIAADVTKEYLSGFGKTLEELFFDITEQEAVNISNVNSGDSI